MRCFAPGVLALCLMLCACGPTGNTDAGPPGLTSGGSSNGTGAATGGSTSGTTGAAIMSHNAGQDCLSCHKSGGAGAGKGIFTVAGTVYNGSGGAQTSATVTIYAAGSNNVQATLSTDGLGNFWTTQAIAALVPAAGQTLVQGVNAVIRPTGGGSRSMLGVISNGSCNTCHSSAGGVGKVTAQVDATPSVHIAAASGGESGAAATALAPANSPTLAQIATGAAHSCVVKADGAVLCWGSNSFGQLGTNGGDQGTPIVASVLGHVTAATSEHSIAAGDHHTCVIAATGNLVLCWGANDQGQLGNGSTEAAPISIIPLAGVTALNATGDSTCARVGADDNASFYCWGRTPQRVDANAANLPPAVVPLLGTAAVTAMTASNVVGLESTSFTHIAAAADHSCGITTDNHVKCWEGTHASVDIPLL
jgi:hypothetical protein